MRCPDCGTNWTNTSRPCIGCGAQFARPRVRAGAPAGTPSWNLPQPGWNPPSVQQPQPVTQATSRGLAQVHQVLAALPLPRRGELTGDVLYIEQVAGEQPDFDWCRMLTRLVWCGITIVVPLVMLHVVFTHLGPLSGLLALFGLYLVFKWLSPNNILSLVHLGIFFNPFGRRNDPTVPVRHLRVRTPEGYETMVRMKGRPLRGAVMQDDEMTFYGTWRDGVLFSRRAFSHRTRSWVEMEVAQSWAGLLASLMVLLTLLYYLHALVSPLVDKAKTVSAPTWQ